MSVEGALRARGMSVMWGGEWCLRWHLNSGILKAAQPRPFDAKRRLIPPHSSLRGYAAASSLTLNPYSQCSTHCVVFAIFAAWKC